jgi:hypothetical protein
VFAFHTLLFALWLIMVDPCFITCRNATQKGIIFLMVLAQKMVTVVQMVMPMLLHELFKNPPCTNLTEVKPVTDVS